MLTLVTLLFVVVVVVVVAVVVWLWSLLLFLLLLLLQALVCWSTHDVYTRAREIDVVDLARLADREQEEVNDEDAMAVVPASPPDDHDELISKVEHGLSLREKLVDVLLTWLKLGEGSDGVEAEGGGSESGSSKAGAYLHRSLQKEAFSMIGSLRTLFPQVMLLLLLMMMMMMMLPTLCLTFINIHISFRI